jgi:hypothetical protein
MRKTVLMIDNQLNKRDQQSQSDNEQERSTKKQHTQDEASTIESISTHDECNPLEEEHLEEIHYFGFGPIVNAMVRHRRCIHTKHVQAAYLRDYRLTFCFGGNASIVPQRGYEVHGLLMTLESREDWKRLLEFDSGNAPTVHHVYPYDKPDHPVACYLFEIPIPEDVSKLDKPIERLPQERYLKLIAQGLRQHGVDDEYVDHQIMAVPFIPNRKPQDYYTFPQQRTPLPKWTWSRYIKKCDKGDKLYFILGKSIFQLNFTDETNPLAKWFKFHGHGKDDCTLAVHKTVVDPEIPTVDEVEDISPLHIAWAENHCVEVIEQYEMSAVKVALLVKDGEDESINVLGRRMKRLWPRKK